MSWTSHEFTPDPTVPQLPPGPAVQALREIVEDPVTISRKELEALKACADAGYSLALWAASIHFDGSRNSRGWLQGLEQRIQRMQRVFTDDLGQKARGFNREATDINGSIH